jgi:hypothetical protein
MVGLSNEIIDDFNPNVTISQVKCRFVIHFLFSITVRSTARHATHFKLEISA